MPNISPQDVLQRYTTLKSSYFDEMHSQIFKSRLTCIGQILPPGVIAALDADDLPAIAYNFPKMYLRDAAGAQRMARVDERVFPIQDGSKEVAGALSKWLKWHGDRNHLQDAYSQCYMDQWMGGFCVMENSRAILDDPLGENQSVTGNPLQHMFDLSVMRPDRKDMFDQMKETYLTAEQLSTVFGMPISTAMSMVKHEQRVSRGRLTGQMDLFGVDAGRHNNPMSFVDPDLVRGVSGNDTARVIEWYFTAYEPRLFIYNLLTATPIDVSEREPEDIAAIKQGLEAAGHPVAIIQQRVRRIYKVCTTDTEILVPASPFGPQVFPYIYALGYKIGNHVVGEAKDLVGPALGVSRALSALTGVVAKSGNTSIITDADGDLDDETIQQANRMAQGWSGIVNIPGMRNIPLVIQHGQMSPELFNYANQSEAIMKAMAGSPNESRGISGGSHQSGIHASQMIQQGQQSGEILRDNFLLMRKLNAETNIRMLQYYEGPIPFRTVRVLADDDTPEEIQFNQMVADKILNDLSVGTYSVKVEQTPYTVTDRHFKMEQTIAAFQAAQIPMPPDLVFKMQDDPDAEKHGQMVRDYQREQLEAQLVASLKNKP